MFDNEPDKQDQEDSLKDYKAGCLKGQPFFCSGLIEIYTELFVISI